MLWIRADIQSKLLGDDMSSTEGCYVEMNLRMNKWLLCYSYNPNYTWKTWQKAHLYIKETIKWWLPRYW